MSLYFAEDLSPKTFRANMSHLVLKTSATRRSQGVDHLFSTTKTTPIQPFLIHNVHVHCVCFHFPDERTQSLTFLTMVTSVKS